MKKLTMAIAVVAAATTLGLGDVQAKDKGKCPPGLAKKGSCVPPGHRKFDRGDIVPGDVAVTVVVDGRKTHLPQTRVGEVYVEIGGRVYLMAEATKRIIEAVNLIDAATK